LTGSEVSGIRAHLAECRRCRREVDLLARDATVGSGLIDWLRRVVLGGADRPSVATPALRWAALAAIAVVAFVFIWIGLQPGGRPGTPGERTIAADRQTDRDTQQPAPVMAQAPGEAVSDDGRPPISASHQDAGAPPTVRPEEVRDGEMSQGVSPPPQLSLIDEGVEPEEAISRALAQLERAEEVGSDSDEAAAAARVAALYHKTREYRNAARYYRRAAAAAENAGQDELRIDSLILAGAALAELGEAKEAREQLESAVRVARDHGYTRGEQNALLQLELLEAPAEERDG
jgi:tetratricopeptide (TPR) repeat protein